MMLSFTPFRFAKASHVDKDDVLRHLKIVLQTGKRSSHTKC